MIFGKRIPATIRGLDRNGNVIQRFPNTTYKTFTVRKFMGTTLQTLRPEVQATRPFGVDPSQLRVVFADWPKGLVSEMPVLPHDTLTVNGINYTIEGMRKAEGSGGYMELYVTVPAESP